MQLGKGLFEIRFPGKHGEFGHQVHLVSNVSEHRWSMTCAIYLVEDANDALLELTRNEIIQGSWEVKQRLSDVHHDQDHVTYFQHTPSNTKGYYSLSLFRLIALHTTVARLPGYVQTNPVVLLHHMSPLCLSSTSQSFPLRVFPPLLLTCHNPNKVFLESQSIPLLLLLRVIPVMPIQRT